MPTYSRPRVGLIIPTLNAGSRWTECLDGVAVQSLTPDRLLVVDSESTDDTVQLARSQGFEVISIERSGFNHGGTRQWAADHLSDCSIVIFLTQDAILADETALVELVKCFDHPKVAVAYGRQIPHKNAVPIETHARLFSYGEKSQVKDMAAALQIGTKVFFCSNSFAAYRRSALIDIGKFRNDLILGEDMEFAARAVKAGHINMYCAQAIAHHSHAYSVWQSLERYFDLGVFEAENQWMREQFGSHTGEGARFVMSELRYLAANGRADIPKALAITAAKLLGYRLGRVHRLLPNVFNEKLSMFPGFWR